MPARVRQSVQVRSIFVPTYEYSSLALPLGELSLKVTERALQPVFPSPSSLRSATSPKGRGKGVRFLYSTVQGCQNSLRLRRTLPV